MADLKTTVERRDRFRTWLHDDTRDHLSIRAWCVAEDACDDVDTLLAENAKLRAVTAQPSEANAVAVLRELVAWDDGRRSGRLSPICDAARRVLAASGPDPMPVVRAAMAWADSRDRGQECSALYRAVDTYRKAGGK